MNEWEWQLLEDKKPVDDLTSPPMTESKSGREAACDCVLFPAATSWISRLPARPRSSRAIEQDYEGKSMSASS